MWNVTSVMSSFHTQERARYGSISYRSFMRTTVMRWTNIWCWLDE